MQRCYFKILLSFRATLSFFVARGRLEKRCTTFIIRRQFKKSLDPLNVLLSPYFSVILHSFVFNWPCALKLLAIPVTLVRGCAVYSRSESGQITIFQFPVRVPGSCLAQIPFADLINRTLLRHAYYAVSPFRYAYFLWHLPTFSVMLFLWNVLFFPCFVNDGRTRRKGKRKEKIVTNLWMKWTGTDHLSEK